METRTYTDLLRGDEAMQLIGATPEWDYRILVSRSQERPEADLYGFMLPEPIPTFPLPLKPEDTDVWVELQSIIQEVYDRAGYAYRLNYRQPILNT